MENRVENPPKWDFRPSKTEIFILAIGVFFFSWNIHKQGLWHDEGYSYLIPQLAYSKFFSYIKEYELSPPLWYIFCKISLFLIPQKIWAIRLFSVLASLGCVYLLSVFLRNKYGRRAAIFGSSLFGSYSPKEFVSALAFNMHPTLAHTIDIYIVILN